MIECRCARAISAPHVPLRLIRGQDALINCAGHVADGDAFVALVNRLVSGLESLRVDEQPVCWFMAGAALLDIGASRRRGVELPKVKATYWPHALNFERLCRWGFDWRLLCPGPMVDEPAIGLSRLRVSRDVLPVHVPAVARAIPRPLLLPVFASLIPQMIVPYADAAALMLANLRSRQPDGPSPRRRCTSRRHARAEVAVVWQSECSGAHDAPEREVAAGRADPHNRQNSRAAVTTGI